MSHLKKKLIMIDTISTDDGIEPVRHRSDTMRIIYKKPAGTVKRHLQWGCYE